MARVLPTVAIYQGNCLSVFWLSLGVPMDLGKVACFTPSRTPFVSMGLFDTTRISIIRMKYRFVFLILIFGIKYPHTLG